MSILARKALADVTRRRGRTLLMVLGVLVGVCGLTAVSQATELLGGAFFYATDASAVPNITVTVDRLPPTLADTIARLPNVAQLAVRPTYTTFWLTGGSQQNLEIDGAADSMPTRSGAASALGAFELVVGRLPGPGEIVMDVSDQSVAAVAVGDTVRVAAPDGRRVVLWVTGLARTRGIALWHTPAAQAIAYMRPDALQQLSTLPAGATAINPLPHGTQMLIRTRDLTTSGRQTYDTITRLLLGARVQIAPGVSRFHDSSFDADAQLGVEGVLAVMLLLAGLALLLVATLISTTISNVLVEQFKVVGTMRALGGTRPRIVWSYLLTIGLYSVAGTALGLALGLAAGYQIAARLAGTVRLQVGSATVPLDVGPFMAAPWALAAGVLAGLLLPLLAALWPLWRGTGIAVREALLAYGIHADGSGRAGAYPRRPRMLRLLSRWVPQTVWLGLRGLLRRPGRASITLMALVLTVAVFLAVQVANDSLRANIEQLGQSFHSDLRIDLTDSDTPVPAQQALAAIQAVHDVRWVEPIDPLPIAIAQRELELYGLSADTHLYQPRLVAGRWLRPAESGSLVVNDFAAARLNLRTGEAITVRWDANTQGDTGAGPQASPGQASLLIVGIVHDINDVSASANPHGRLGAAFTTLDTLNRLRGAPLDAAERLWLRARDRAPGDLRQLQRQVEDTLQSLGFSGAYVLPIAQDVAQVSGTQQVVYALFDAAALLVALMGMLGLTLTLAASVVERQAEIGVLRALGASGRRVGAVFGIQGLALGGIAWVFGAALGFAGGVAIVHLLSVFMPPLDVAVQPIQLALALLFAVGVATLASVGPALAAAHLRVARVLRYE